MKAHMDQMTKSMVDFAKATEAFILSLEKLENVSHFIVHDEITIQINEQDPEKRQKLQDEINLGMAKVMKDELENSQSNTR